MVGCQGRAGRLPHWTRSVVLRRTRRRGHARAGGGACGQADVHPHAAEHGHTARNGRQPRLQAAGEGRWRAHGWICALWVGYYVERHGFERPGAGLEVRCHRCMVPKPAANIHAWPIMQRHGRPGASHHGCQHKQSGSAAPVCLDAPGCGASSSWPAGSQAGGEEHDTAAANKTHVEARRLAGWRGAQQQIGESQTSELTQPNGVGGYRVAVAVSMTVRQSCRFLAPPPAGASWGPLVSWAMSQARLGRPQAPAACCR